MVVALGEMRGGGTADRGVVAGDPRQNDLGTRIREIHHRNAVMPERHHVLDYRLVVAQGDECAVAVPSGEGVPESVGDGEMPVVLARETGDSRKASRRRRGDQEQDVLQFHECEVSHT